MLLCHWSNEQHVRALFVQIEPFGRTLPQHGLCDRRKAVTEFDLEVHSLLHLRRARVAKYRAATQCARAEFHTALKPADDLLARNEIGDSLRNFVLPELHEWRVLRAQKDPNFF